METARERKKPRRRPAEGGALRPREKTRPRPGHGCVRARGQVRDPRAAGKRTSARTPETCRLSATAADQAGKKRDGEPDGNARRGSRPRCPTGRQRRHTASKAELSAGREPCNHGEEDDNPGRVGEGREGEPPPRTTAGAQLHHSPRRGPSPRAERRRRWRHPCAAGTKNQGHADGPDPPRRPQPWSRAATGRNLKKKKDSPEPRTAAGKDRHKERRERRSHDAGGRDSLRSARQGQRPETAVWRTEM